jgi:tetratricopeptide (TPR) repeat protein
MAKKKVTAPETEVKNVNLDELLKRATRAVEKGRYREAITDLEIVTEMVPEHSEAWNNLGVANLLVGDMDQAEKSFRSGLEQDPENPQMIKNLIQTLLQMDSKVEEGMNLLVRFIQLRPSDPDAMYMLGRCLQAGKDYPRARAVFDKVLELDNSYELAREALREMLS